MTIQTLKIDDKELVIIDKRAFDELMEKAGVMPPLPPADQKGRRPAVDTCTALIARKIVTHRIKAGLTQKELSRRAGIRLETVCRIEGGKQKPNRETILRIESALAKAGTAK